ncbi:flagellar basal body P-ring formation chaperone FlgA [Parvularcula maris]|uniref:Flagella basal body P-ring formation protein FlgA n=1 Tax=Parvularcula maris TaxID=2965077 RepID=A0A9X2L883_9PROT|nr:flagellar basal body P-ring formation chaperone FlgA [Parvularcula maris]MCQ8184900.1 flagellar basal body P-ring formation chaperone FlgA [Parvularcula maris]
MRWLLAAALFMGSASAEVTANAALPRGTILISSDLSGPRAEVDRMVGLEARRPLFAGRTVRPTDLREPRAVKRQQAVSVIFVRGLLVLRTEGRAAGEGAVGDSVDILLEGRRAPIRARVTGPGRVEVAS